MSTISMDTLKGLVKRDRSPSAFVVYFYLWSRKGGSVSHQEIADATGISKSVVQRAIHLLNRRRLIRTVHASPTATPVHHVVRR